MADQDVNDPDITWDELHPATRGLLSRRGFILGAGTGAAAFTFLGLTVTGCSSTTSATSGTTTAGPSGTAPSTTKAVTATTAGSAGTAAGGRTLYERLGGAAAVTAVVGNFLQTVGQDSRINTFFANTNLDNLKTQVVNQLGQATGGPQKYTGRDMKTAHAGLGITMADFNAFVEDLTKTLTAAGVPAQEQQELLSALAPMQADIVTA